MTGLLCVVLLSKFLEYINNVHAFYFYVTAFNFNYFVTSVALFLMCVL